MTDAIEWVMRYELLRSREIGRQFNRLREQDSCRDIVVSPDTILSLQIEVVRLHVVGGSASTGKFTGIELTTQRSDDFLRDVVLQLENVGHFPVVTL